MKIPQTPPNWMEVFMDLQQEGTEKLLAVMEAGPAPKGQYRHWDTLRRSPPPAGLTAEQWWAGIKMSRRPLYREIPLLDKAGQPFKYGLPDPVLERLHRIDRDASGHIALPEEAISPERRDRYIINSLIEESITSSQLEGAATTREVAKKMIRSGRQPTNKSERMILNNYIAMRRVRELLDEELTPELIDEVHRIVTRGTMPEGHSKYRTPNDGIAVYSSDNVLLHAPPSPEELPERIERMCRFANEAATGVFLHPVIKSVILHFWLAYDHPYTDGNGRTARALFYWSMLREGFWLSEFISISRILKKAPARYGRSFLYTETDDNDLTYFILAQLRVIEQAIDELKSYIRRKMDEMKKTKQLLKPSAELNHRQIAILSHAIRHPGHEYTVQSHQNSQNVAYDTARTDLLDLVEKGLLDQMSSGRKFIFKAPGDIVDRLAKMHTENVAT